MTVDRVSLTCTSGVNIAVIKYWGKRDENLILPLNSSLSATLDQADLKTITTVVASKTFEKDEIWLNGKKEDINTDRLQRVIKEIRERAGVYKDETTGEIIVKRSEWKEYKIHIISENNFPTAAGLASSASGYCCLVYTLAQLYGVEGEISTIARMGSGSACRSIYGGWVKWEMGQSNDGSDSIAVQLCDENYWKEVEIVVLVVNDQKKDTSSTSGMEQSVKTSNLLKERITNIVPNRMIQIENAILNKDFNTFGDLTMKDSDNFHDVCADTTPSIYYLKQISKDIIHIIHCFNDYQKTIKAAYTFDAGPNAVIYLLKETVVPILALAFHYFPPQKTTIESYFRNSTLIDQIKNYQLPQQLLDTINLQIQPDALKYILHTRPGPGPIKLSKSHSLADPFTGLPK